MDNLVSPPGKNLTKKLAKVLGEIERIPKNGYNDYHKYSYATESDVADHIRKMVSDVGIFIYADTYKAEDVDASRGILRVYTRFTFSDSESGESWTVGSIGDAQDIGSKGRGDKGIYKAITGAAKYFQMKNFMIPTGDDPEKEPPQKKPSAKEEQAAPAAKKPGVISEAQRKRLFAISKKANWSNDEVKGFIKLKCDATSTNDIPSAVYNEICEYIEKNTHA